MIIFKTFITREFVQSHPSILFVFGDNDMRIGNGGQAREMRGEMNSFGIRVKKFAGTSKQCYYYDNEYDDNLRKIKADFYLLETYLKEGRTVVIPTNGVGTGLAKLKENAPKTLEFINKQINDLCTKYGVKQEEQNG